MAFSEYLLKKFLELQIQRGRKMNVTDLAAYLGVAQSTVSSWMNGTREPEGDSLVKIAEKFGLDVYDSLGKDRPDPDLHYIQQNWNDLSLAARRKLRDQVMQDAENNKKKKK